ncbi:MAG: flagellar M-ring protein FliF [Bryobacterales bacterium]|nr:flagellar M-ring protein FliF [Bryobacterales bacterium]
MEQLRKLLASLSLRQRVTIGVAVVAIVAALLGLRSWNRERGFKPLYSGLAAEDAGAVVERLRADGVEFRIDETGGVIRVPAEQVAEARLKMAASGLPKTGRIGFELFDQNNFGLTEFAEQVNFRRAIEGELERSILSLSEIEHARVHISLPRDSVFLESRQEAKASVVVTLRSGRALSAQNGQAICHLVASAVDRLAPEAVTVVDTTGRLLVRPRKTSGEEGAEPPEETLEYKLKLERDLVQKIHLTLEPLLGSERFRASAAVDIDLTSGEQSEETFDPSRSVMLNSQKSEDTSGSAISGGVPGTASNLPRPDARTAGKAGVSASRRSENVTFQTSKTVRRLRLPKGALKRMSLAIVLDQELRWEGEGPGAKRVLVPPDPATVESIRQLVAAATGLSEERGDVLTVETLPFDSTRHAEPPPSPAAPPDQPGGMPAPWRTLLEQMNPALLAGVALGVLLLLGAPLAYFLVRARRRKRVQAELPRALAGVEGESGDAGEDAGERLAAREAERARLEREALASLRLPPVETKKSEVLNKHLREQAKKDAEGMAQLIRTWIHENET